MFLPQPRSQSAIKCVLIVLQDKSQETTLIAYMLLLLSHVQLCATHRWQPTRLPHSWDSPGKNTGVGCHCLLQIAYIESPIHVYRLLYFLNSQKKGGKMELLWNKNSFGHWITMYRMSSCNTLNSDSYDLSSFPKNEYLYLFLTRSFILNIHKML